MSDIQITINDIPRNFDLATENGQKMFSVREEPIVPLKALSDVPSYGDLPLDKMLALVQNNWRGGMGQKEHFIFKDMYADGENIDTRDPNQIFLGPLINTIGAINATIIALEFFGNREYAASTTKVYKLNTAGTTWDTVLTIAGDTIECLSQYDGYIICGLTTGKYYYSTTGDSGGWTQCTLDNAVAHVLCVSPPFSGSKDVLVSAKRPNEVRTAIAPWNAGAGWLDPPYYVGDIGSDITGLAIINGVLFVGKTDGFYALPVDGRPVAIMPEFKNKRDSTNFKYWTNWQSVFYGSLAGDIVEIVGNSNSVYSIDYMGPLERSPELAMTGSVKSLTCDDKSIYVVMLVGTSYIIYAGRERFDDVYGLRWEWTPLISLSTNVCGVAKVMQRTGENPKLWFAYGTNMANTVLSRSPNFPLGDTNYRFCTTGYLITTYFDANYDIWSKIFYQLWTIARNIVFGSIYVNVYYQKDYETAWTLLATVSKNEVQSVNLPALSCKRVRLKVELNSSVSTTTPIIQEFIYHGILQPEVTRILDFTVILSQSDSRKPSSDLKFLRSGRIATSPIIMRDLRFDTTRYIMFLTNSPMEIETVDEKSGQPSYRARILAQELEWIPP